jgi:hypothetical protein
MLRPSRQPSNRIRLSWFGVLAVAAALSSSFVHVVVARSSSGARSAVAAGA